jgi:hypothetical protein
VSLATREYERGATALEPRNHLWCADLGRAEVEVRFSAHVTRTLRVGTAQMLALVFFNTHTIGSTAQLTKATGVARDPLALELLAMAHPKVAVPLKRPNCKEVKPDDRWCLNFRYAPPPPPPTPSSSSSTATADSVIVVPPRLGGVSARQVLTELNRSDRDTGRDRLLRRLADDAIVREMKTRRVMTDDRLFSAVSSQICETHRLVITRQEYAARIQALIADKYL